MASKSAPAPDWRVRIQSEQRHTDSDAHYFAWVVRLTVCMIWLVVVQREVNQTAKFPSPILLLDWCSEWVARKIPQPENLLSSIDKLDSPASPSSSSIPHFPSPAYSCCLMFDGLEKTGRGDSAERLTLPFLFSLFSCSAVQLNNRQSIWHTGRVSCTNRHQPSVSQIYYSLLFLLLPFFLSPSFLSTHRVTPSFFSHLTAVCVWRNILPETSNNLLSGDREEKWAE